jgi:hypothetical protein
MQTARVIGTLSTGTVPRVGALGSQMMPQKYFVTVHNVVHFLHGNFFFRF